MLIMIASLMVAGCGLAAWSAPVNAQTTHYDFTKIADGSTARPDGQGNFNLEWYWTPSLDGQSVVLLDAFNELTFPIDSIWTAPAGGGTLKKLVAAGEAAPGGTGAFALLSNPIGPTARNGITVFQSLDQSGQGVYTVKTKGGAPKLVVNYTHKMPNGAAFGFNFGGAESTMTGVATDGDHVAINTGKGQLLVAAINGAELTESVDTAFIGSAPISPDVPVGVALKSPNTCFWGTQYAPRDSGVAISGSNLIFTSGGAWDEETGQALYRTPVNGFPNGSYVSCWGTQINPPTLANVTTPLPGDPNAATTNDGFASYVADGNEVAYVIGDGGRFAGGLGPYQCVILQEANGKDPVAVTCSQTLLPGLTKLPVYYTGLSMKDQTLVFAVRDSADNVGLYAYQGHAITKIVASGDVLAGSPVQSRAQEPDLTISPTATSGGGVAFNAVTGNGVGAYTALPSACAANVTSSFAVVQGAVKAEGAGRFYQVVTLRNTTKSAIDGTLALVLDGLSGAVLKGGDTTFCSDPAGEPYVIVDLGPGQKLNAGKTVTVGLTFTGSLPIAYRPAVLQGFSR